MNTPARTGRKPFNLVLIGDPASGKATQGAWLARQYNLFNFDMGRELRKMQNNPFIRRRYDLPASWKRGTLTPTSIVRGILRRKIGAMSPARGILFNGHPKMLGEAKFLARELKRRGRSGILVIYLHIPLREVAARARKRGRPDDTPRALIGRRKYYRRSIRAVAAFWKRQYPFKKISGLGTRAEVFHRIRSFVEQHVNDAQ